MPWRSWKKNQSKKWMVQYSLDSSGSLSKILRVEIWSKYLTMDNNVGPWFLGKRMSYQSFLLTLFHICSEIHQSDLITEWKKLIKAIRFTSNISTSCWEKSPKKGVQNAMCFSPIQWEEMNSMHQKHHYTSFQIIYAILWNRVW